MKTQQRPLKLLVLVPHRDVRLPLRNWSAALFGSGCVGAWSFPHVAPLAVLSRPLSAEALRRAAVILRSASFAGAGGGKIRSAVLGANCVIASAAFGEAVSVFGPVLDFTVPQSVFADNAEKIAYRFPKLLLGTCLACGVENYAALPPLPAFAFRAAALANMSYYPQCRADGAIEHTGCSFGWRIGRLYWLPSVKKGSVRHE